MGGQKAIVAGLGIAAGIVWAAAAAGGAAEAHAPGEAGERLGTAIELAIKAEGPFFTAEERKTIEAKCGYAPGSWDGFEANISDHTFRCRDGKRVDDPEMRALLAAAQPRIERRVKAAMAREDVQAAIAEVAERAQAEALRAVDSARLAEKAAAQAAQAVERALEESRRARR